LNTSEVEIFQVDVEVLNDRLSAEGRKLQVAETESNRLRRTIEAHEAHRLNLESRIEGQESALQRLATRNASLAHEAHGHALALISEREAHALALALAGEREAGALALAGEREASALALADEREASALALADEREASALALADEREASAQLAAELARCGEELARCTEELLKRDSAIAALHEELEHQAKAHASALECARGASVAEITQLHFQLLKQLQRVTELQEAELHRVALIEHVRAEHAGAVAGLQAQLTALESRSATFEASESELQSALAAIHSSNSWRLTAGARFVRRSISRLAASLPKVRGNKPLPIFPIPAPSLIHMKAEQVVDGSPPASAGDETFKEESSTLDPSEFDLNYYLQRYPDVARSSMDPYHHYCANGKAEGRAGRPPKLKLQRLRALHPDRDCILIVSHEATRTGAPVLAWNICNQLRERYNVVVLLLDSGDILESFEDVCNVLVGPYQPGDRSDLGLQAILNEVCDLFNPRLALVNSIVSRSTLPGLAKKNVPSILLVHEFFRFHCSEMDLVDAMGWAASTVFSANIIRDHATTERTRAAIEAAPIIAQGKSIIPPSSKLLAPKPGKDPLSTLLARRKSRPFVVLGVGTFEYRKGVDLFVATAAEMLRQDSNADILFVWIGAAHAIHREYAAFVAQQVEASNLGDRFHLLGVTSELEAIYARAQVFFVSSRLDPLPNVALDAMTAGLPVMCFENGSGLVENFEADQIARTCIVPSLNVQEAARQILALYRQPDTYKSVSNRMKELAAEKFEMQRYVDRLLSLGETLTDAVEQLKLDIQALERGPDFLTDFYLPPRSPRSREDAIREYVIATQSGIYGRKALPGFDPLGYAKAAGIDRKANALAHYVAAGRPVGPWRLPVLGSFEGFPILPTTLKVGIHIHAFYTDLLSDIVERVQANALSCDLLVSVCSDEAAEAARSRLVGFSGGACDVRVVRNLGRDIGPMLAVFGETLCNYDVIGHFHTKKSTHVTEVNLVPDWINFLMGNLLGGETPRARSILSAFVEQPSLGLVFADDPNSIGWDKNLPFAEELAARMGIDTLPKHFFSFPTGTMFWARPKALQPLLDLHLGENDFPPEPVPIDGSMLHAVERMLPIITHHAGYGTAVSHVAGLSR